MRLGYFLVILLVSVVLLSFFQRYGLLAEFSLLGGDPDVFVGVDVAHGNMTEIRLLVDRISAYTNLFVIGSTWISHNETRLNEVCQYMYDKGLSFIVYTERRFQRRWFDEAKGRWGDHFLGFYVWDENAGKQLDLYEYRAVMEADNYSDAATQFVSRMKLSFTFLSYADPEVSPLFTSDYALYWFDYLAGYDVVLAQLGWNYSRQLNLALCRGAATVMNKEWGAIITYTYNHPPYLESGQRLFEDMVLAYENGAEYILVFDSNHEFTKGILEEGHLDAFKRFWVYATNNPRERVHAIGRVAYVLPKDYAYGFRGPDDKIWGLWEADDLSLLISTDLGEKLNQFGKELDIVYDNPELLERTDAYSQLIYWNGATRER